MQGIPYKETTMKDFMYDSGVCVYYGAGQTENVVREIAKLGGRLLIVPTGSSIRTRTLPPEGLALKVSRRLEI